MNRLAVHGIHILLVLCIIVSCHACASQNRNAEKVQDTSRLDAELAFLLYLRHCPNWERYADITAPSTILFPVDVCTIDTEGRFDSIRMTSQQAEAALRLPAIAKADGAFVVWGGYYVLLEGTKEVQSLMKLVKVNRHKQDTPGAYSCLSEPGGSAVFYKLEGNRKRITEILTITCDWYSIDGLKQEHEYGRAYLSDASQKAILRFLAARKKKIRPEIVHRYYMDLEKRRVDVDHGTDRTAE